MLSSPQYFHHTHSTWQSLWSSQFHSFHLYSHHAFIITIHPPFIIRTKNPLHSTIHSSKQHHDHIPPLFTTQKEHHNPFHHHISSPFTTGKEHHNSIKSTVFSSSDSLSLHHKHITPQYIWSHRTFIPTFLSPHAESILSPFITPESPLTHPGGLTKRTKNIMLLISVPFEA